MRAIYYFWWKSWRSFGCVEEIFIMKVFLVVVLKILDVKVVLLVWEENLVELVNLVAKKEIFVIEEMVEQSIGKI